METVPRIAKMGGALGFIGGIAAILCMALFFEADEKMLAIMGAYMLIAVMFFALAGGFARDGKWSWDVLLVMTFLTVSAVGCAVIFDVADLYAGIVLIMIGVLIIACLSAPSSKTWANRTRF
jgi:hypothetical protein